MQLSPASEWIRVLFTVVCWALAPLPARAADAEGRFAIEGVGIQTCRQFLEARAARSETYERFSGWVEGYLTAANRYELEAYDITPWETTEVLAIILETHCREAPDERFFRVVQVLSDTLRQTRLQVNSPTIYAEVGGRSFIVYQEVLRSAQIELAKRGLYGDTADGLYGPSTLQAIKAFQQSEGLETTGLPDSLTLWRLLRP